MEGTGCVFPSTKINQSKREMGSRGERGEAESSRDEVK